jgi:hypothetical protein
VQLSGERLEDVSLVTPLEPFRLPAGASDIQVRVEWVGNLPQASGRPLFNSGTTWTLHENEVGFQFEFKADIFGNRSFKRLVSDRQFQTATLQMSEECLKVFPWAIEPLGYPLDELLIMHRLTQERAIELHGSGIVRPNGEGNLFVGHSGAGKSTTTCLWTSREEVEVLSDDRIIVRPDEQREVSSRIEATGTVEVPWGSLKAGHRLAKDDKAAGGRRARHSLKAAPMRMYGTPWHGEAMFASPNNAALSRVFVLEHGRGNVITRLSPSQAVAELFARAFVPFHRHEYVESALTFLEQLTDSVPCYRFAFEPDERAVDRIINFHD